MLLLCLPRIILVWSSKLQSCSIANVRMHRRGESGEIVELQLERMAAICSAVSFICIYMLGRCFCKCQSLFCLRVVVLLMLDPSCIKLYLCQYSGDPGFGSEMMWIVQWTFGMLTPCFSYSFQTLFSLWFGGALWLMCNCKQIAILLHICTGFQVACGRTWLLFGLEGNYSPPVDSPFKKGTPVSKDLFITLF